MQWRQLVPPRTWVQDYAGWCLRFAQAVFGAPAMYYSAWESWEHAQKRSAMPHPTNIAVVLYFSHWGTYGSPPTYGNWGHVVVWVPGVGYLSSPGSGYGAAWFPTIAAVEAYFGAKYAGWTPYMNTLPVAEQVKQIIEEDDMGTYYSLYRGKGFAGKTASVKSINPAAGVQAIKPGKTHLYVNNKYEPTIANGRKKLALVVTVDFTGTPGTRFKLGAERGTWAKGKGWKTASFLEEVTVEIGADGVAKAQLSINNDLPAGQRLRCFVNLPKSAAQITATRYSVKGFVQ